MSERGSFGFRIVKIKHINTAGIGMRKIIEGNCWFWRRSTATGSVRMDGILKDDSLFRSGNGTGSVQMAGILNDDSLFLFLRTTGTGNVRMAGILRGILFVRKKRFRLKSTGRDYPPNPMGSTISSNSNYHEGPLNSTSRFLTELGQRG
jgi:hypothetical protein